MLAVRAFVAAFQALLRKGQPTQNCTGMVRISRIQP
jgi:hypothetical protein